MELFDKNEKQQKFHAKMLSDSKIILDKHDIKYFIAGAALLGAIRENDLIKWERGLPLMVDSRQAIKKQSVLIKDFGKSFTIGKCFSKVENWKIRMYRDFEGIKYFIEIVGHYKKGNEYLRKLKRKIKIIPSEFYDKPFKQIEIRGVKYNIPYNSEKFLTWVYGDWRTPIRSNNPSKFRAKTFTRVS